MGSAAVNFLFINMWKKWRNFWLPASSRPRDLVLPALLFCVGAAAFLYHYSAASDGYFMREDSRYFSNGLFSFYDVWYAFTSPYNTMGHYRPITKLLWGVPEWLGAESASVFFALTQIYLALAAVFLIRLSYLLFGDSLLAILAGVLFALMPVNAKPVYWISASQDTTALLFVLSAIVFRFEQWRQPARSRLFCTLCFVSLFFAITSREVGFIAGPMLLLTDWRFGKLRQSFPVLFFVAAAAILIYVVHPPFHRANVHPSVLSLLSLQTFRELWGYSLSTPFTLGDAESFSYPLFAQVLSGALLLLAVASPFLHRSLLFAAVLMAGGIAPFLLIHAVSVEYAFLFGAGMALLFTGAPALLLKEYRWRFGVKLAVFFFSLATIFAYLQFLKPSRDIFAGNYVKHSQQVRDFIIELRDFTRTLPPYRAVHLTSLEPYASSEARDSNHFIPLGIDKLIPDRAFLIAPEVLNSGEGTNWKNPSLFLWSEALAKADPPVRIHYTPKGFVRD